MTRIELISTIHDDALASNCRIPATFWEKIRFFFFPDYPLRYIMQLRFVEYLLSTRDKGVIHAFRTKMALSRLRRMGRKLSYEIHPFSFGPGLGLFHNGIIVNSKVRAGKNCTLRAYTVIGNKGGADCGDAPHIGDNVDIGCNCSIIGGITIGDNVTIGAGSVVVTDLPSNSVCVGNPARVIRQKSLQ